MMKENILPTLLLLTTLSHFSQHIFAQAYKDNKFTSYFQQSGSGLLASDGTISLELPDGRNMWFMGDSHIDQPINSDGEIPCLFNARNCIVVQECMDVCQSTINLSGNIEYGTYHASNTMNINGEVTEGSNVTFKAGNHISIQSGFKVEQGSNCKIEIDDCP